MLDKLKKLPYYKDLNPKGINHIEQNKPSLVARDLKRAYGVPEAVTHAVMLARGVYKWLAVRRKLIALKNEWRDKLTKLQNEARKYPRGSLERARISGYINGLTEARQAIRKLCHLTRWQAPDNDHEAQTFLECLKGDKLAERILHYRWKLAEGASQTEDEIEVRFANNVERIKIGDYLLLKRAHDHSLIMLVNVVGFSHESGLLFIVAYLPEFTKTFGVLNPEEYHLIDSRPCIDEKLLHEEFTKEV